MTNPAPDSLPALRETVARNPADFIAWVMLSDAELDAGDANAGLAAAEHALKLRPGHPEALARLGRSYWTMNRHAEAVSALRAASLHYFHRQPENLKPAQAAMLAGLMQAPSRLAPTKHFQRAEKRMHLVLQAMVDAGYMTAAEARAVGTPSRDKAVKSSMDWPKGTRSSSIPCWNRVGVLMAAAYLSGEWSKSVSKRS